MGHPLVACRDRETNMTSHADSANPPSNTLCQGKTSLTTKDAGLTTYQRQGIQFEWLDE
jgi:hypothetical protein